MDEIIRLENLFDKMREWYYFTNQLKHNNEKIVKFPSDIDKYPFKSVTGDNTKFRVLESGYYHLIYFDQCKYCGIFAINDVTNGTTTKFRSYTNYNNKIWIALTANAVINIQTHDGFGYANLELEAYKSHEDHNEEPSLDGLGHSSFYIKYLRA